MSQPSSTTNWVIQDSNGQSQMVKLVQPSGKTINGYMTNATSVKIFKPVSGTSGQAETSQTYQTISTHTGHPQMIRTIASSPTKRSIPGQMNTMKPATKTIRLTPSQMQRLMNTTQVMPHQQQYQRQEVATHHLQQSQGVHHSFSQGVPVIQHSSPVKNQSVTSQILSSPISNRKRTELPYPTDGPPETKRSRARADKIGKGLRHFSMKVCEKVKQKGTTTYNEVADELVKEFTNPTNPESLADQYDQKNIRRRVYDALNVLMAMNIISKEKKEIRWIGLPSNSVQVKPKECQQLEREVLRRSNTIREKEKHLYELIMNQIAFKSLAQRNKDLERMQGPPTLNSSIQLPFIVVNTNKKTVINCSISNDKTEYMFQFSDKFEINDDLEVLKQIGMLHGLDTGTCSRESLEKIKTLIPESLWPYLEKIAAGCKDPLADLFDPASSTSTQTHSLSDDFVEATIDETSRQSGSSGAISPPTVEYSEDGDSDTSSDTEIN